MLTGREFGPAQATVTGVSVSRLHALIVVARLKRKGVAGESISAFGLPGSVPDGVELRIRGLKFPHFHTQDGDLVEVAGPLQQRVSHDVPGALEQVLKEMGMSETHLFTYLAAVKETRVILCVDTCMPGDLTVALDVFSENSIDAVQVLPGALFRSSSRHPLEFSLPIASRTRGDNFGSVRVAG